MICTPPHTPNNNNEAQPWKNQLSPATVVPKLTNLTWLKPTFLNRPTSSLRSLQTNAKAEANGNLLGRCWLMKCNGLGWGRMLQVRIHTNPD